MECSATGSEYEGEHWQVQGTNKNTSVWRDRGVEMTSVNIQLSKKSYKRVCPVAWKRSVYGLYQTMYYYYSIPTKRTYDKDFDA